MKKITLSIFALAMCAGAHAQKLDRSIKPKPGPAPEIKLGRTESFTLPNGMRVFVVENHKLPTISCSIELDIKPALEGDMAGYRDMMSELLSAGTTTRSKDKLNSEIDMMGARINVNSEGMSGSALKKYQEKLFGLMADIAMNAVINEDELEKTKKKALSGMETEKNDPDAMVRNVSAVVNFGSAHPYGEVPTEESVKKISRDRCISYYKTYFRPNVAYMAIVGDVTIAEVQPLIEKYFGAWQKGEVPRTEYVIPMLSAAQSNKMTKVDFAPRTAAVQSVVSVTYPVDLKPGSADVIKARVANTVLGGGSQGRLFLDLREKHAWTYGAYSSLREDDLGGSFSATVKCRNAVSDSAVGALLEQMKLMQTEPVNDTALQNSITYLSGNFAIGLEDPKRVAQYAINIERYNMPKDYYQNYLKKLSAVTSKDIMEMSVKYIKPDHANIVVAGSKEEVAGKLARFSADGKVDFYDYAGNSIVPSETKAAPAGLNADQVYSKYLTAIGGEKAISALKDIKTTGKMEMQGISLTIVEMKKAPNKYLQTVSYSVQGRTVSQKQVFNGTTGYAEAGPQKKELTGDELEVVKQDADIAFDIHGAKYGIKRTLKGMEAVNGKDAYVLDVVNGAGKKSTEYYDATNGLLVKKVKGQGEELEIAEFGDYREVPGTNGYKVPYKVTQTAGGQTMSQDVQTVEINKGVPDTEFN